MRAATPEECLRVCREMGYVPTADVRGIVAVDRNGLVAGGVAYDFWTDFAVHAHMWVPSPAVGRAILEPAFEYPFEHAGRGLVLGFIPEHRERACRLARHLGFVEFNRIADGWAKGDAMIVFGMRREACRFLRKKAA